MRSMRIALLSTSDTDLLSARASGADYVWANPVPPRPPVHGRDHRGCRPRGRAHPGLAARPVLRLRPHPGDRACRWSCSVASSSPSAELMELLDGADRRRGRRRTATSPRAARPTWRSCTRSSPTPCCSPARASRPPARAAPAWGARCERPAADQRTRPARRRAVLPRPPGRAGTPPSSHALADAIDATGEAVGVPIFCVLAARPRPTSCSTPSAASTPWWSPCSPPAAASRPRASAGGDDEAWDVERHRRARHPDPAGAVPDQQPRRSGRRPTTASPRSTRPPRSRSRSSTAASSPRRSRSRRSTRTGCRATSPTPSAAPGWPASRSTTPGCATIPPSRAQGRADAVGVPHQALPDRQRRRPGHPGLDDPAAAPDARRGLRPRRPRATSPDLERDDDTEAGDALIHALIAAGGQDEEWLTAGAAHRARTCGSPAARLRALDRRPAPASLTRRDDRGLGRGARASSSSTTASEIVLATIRAGNVVLARSSRRAASARTRSRSTTTPTCRRPTTTSRPTAGSEARRFGAARRRAPRQARLDGVAARQERRAVRVLRHRRGDRRPAADLPVPRQRPGRGRAGQAPRARHDRRPPDPADGARRVATATSPGSSSCSTSTPTSRRWTRPSCRRSAARSGR